MLNSHEKKKKLNRERKKTQLRTKIEQITSEINSSKEKSYEKKKKAKAQNLIIKDDMKQKIQQNDENPKIISIIHEGKA